MTLNPITVIDQVLDEYRSYLETEFQARDPELRAALEAALVETGFLAQEPFFQAHRPFKNGGRWSELGLAMHGSHGSWKRGAARSSPTSTRARPSPDFSGLKRDRSP